MKTKLLKQPIEETTIVRHKGAIIDSYSSFRDFEKYIGESNQTNYAIKEPLNEQSPESFIYDHSNEIAHIQINQTSIQINTPRVQCQNWWGVMNPRERNILTMTYVRDLINANYEVRGGETT